MSAKNRSRDLLWPESEGDTAHIGFKTLLSRLRQLLGVKDAIEFQGGKASLNPETCWVDAWAFEEIFLQAKKAWEDKRGRTMWEGHKTHRNGPGYL